MNIQLLRSIFLNTKNAIHFFRIQDFLHGQRTMNVITSQLNQFLTTPDAALLGDSILSVTQTLQDLLTTQQNNDTVLLADLLEIQLLPFIDALLQEAVLSASEPTTPDYLEANLQLLSNQTLANQIRQHTLSSLYTIELTNLGLYTVKYNGTPALYYHSNVNPVAEANAFASYYGKSDTFSYTLFGFGLGYHAQALLRHDRRYTVTVVETNLDILKIAFTCMDFSTLLTNKRFSLEYCTLASMKDILNRTSTLLIHYPSFQQLSPSPLKDALNHYFISLNTIYSQEKLLNWNFYDNQKLGDANIDALRPVFENKAITYIGGGPSLEYCIKDLQTKTFKPDELLICASTVYRHLLEHQIIPDYVMMIDPQNHMIRHLQDIPEQKTALLYLCTAASNAMQAFHGKRYCIFQRDYPDANTLATSQGYTLFETGGSVSTLAIDLAIRFGCKQFTAIGLDLGYTNNQTHAFKSSQSNHSPSLLEVKSTSGATILTTHILNTYRLWIEKRIQNEHEISFINLSNGAYIQGMQNFRI